MELKEEILKALEHLVDQIEYECEIEYGARLAQHKTVTKSTFRPIYLRFLKQAYAMGMIRGNNEGYDNGSRIRLFGNSPNKKPG